MSDVRDGEVLNAHEPNATEEVMVTPEDGAVKAGDLLGDVARQVNGDHADAVDTITQRVTRREGPVTVDIGRYAPEFQAAVLDDDDAVGFSLALELRLGVVGNTTLGHVGGDAANVIGHRHNRRLGRWQRIHHKAERI